VTEIFQYIAHLNDYLSKLVEILGNWSYLIMFTIVMLETGVVVLAPFLPSDTMLFTAGTLSAFGSLDLKILLLAFYSGALAGDSLNFLIGKICSPKLFKNRLLHDRKTLEKARKFYRKNGGITVVYGRFIPVIRTFVPFLAGSASMPYNKFILFSIPGTFLWVIVYCLSGYFFGNIPAVQNNFFWVLAGLAVIGILPGLIQLSIRAIHRSFQKKILITRLKNVYDTKSQ
jgi:membrane-associated protein